MTPTTQPYPLSESRQEFIHLAARLDRCRAAYATMGMVDEALKLERALEYLGESVRILDRIIGETGGEEKP